MRCECVLSADLFFSLSLPSEWLELISCLFAIAHGLTCNAIWYVICVCKYCCRSIKRMNNGRFMLLSHSIESLRLIWQTLRRLYCKERLWLRHKERRKLLAGVPCLVCAKCAMHVWVVAAAVTALFTLGICLFPLAPRCKHSLQFSRREYNFILLSQAPGTTKVLIYFIYCS